MEPNKQKILDISKELGLSHIGSCISVLPILEEIYAKKKPEDKVILDNAHAHLAHLVVKESKDILFDYGSHIEPYIARYLIKQHGIHCDRKAGCDASGGSLGHGIGIGIGMALANPNITVYVVVSDGSMMEGSNWEALRILDSLKLNNIQIHCNFNGCTAVAQSDPHDIYMKMLQFHKPTFMHLTNNGEGFDGVQGHYKKL